MLTILDLRKKPIENVWFKRINKDEINNYIYPKQKVKISNGMFVNFQNQCLAPINSSGFRVAMKSGYYLNIHIDLLTNELCIIISKN